MLRVARSILVVCMAVATFVAASLQGRVLCSANSGAHFAIEQPHRETGCPSGHDDEHPGADGEHQRLPGDCTDISAEFSLAREAAPPSIDVLHAPLVGALALSPVLFTAPLELDVHAHALRGHPPGSGELASLRTVVLLV